MQSAAVAYNEAEFDWCGSFPLALRTDEDEFDDADAEGAEDDGNEGDVVSVVARWDYRVVDPHALLAAGRSAYSQTWPDDTEEDANIAVQSPPDAVSEMLHMPALTQLEGANGLEIGQVWVETYIHDGTETDEDDPFDIVYE